MAAANRLDISLAPAVEVVQANNDARGVHYLLGA